MPKRKRSLDAHLRKVLDDNEYLADLFHLLHFDEVRVSEPSAQPPVLLVPAGIDRLFTQRSTESEDLLTALVLWARPDTASLSPAAIAELVTTIRSRYIQLRESKLVRPIADEADAEILNVLRKLLPDSSPRGSLVDRMTQTVRKSVTTVLTVSKRTGKAILMRGRDLSRLLRKGVDQLEIAAEKSDDLVKKKTEFTARIFAFKGGRATKFFVGFTLGAAGLIVAPVAPAATPIAAAGFMFALVDP